MPQARLLKSDCQGRPGSLQMSRGRQRSPGWLRRRSPEIGRHLLMRLPSLIEHGDAVDLDIDTSSVRHAAKTGSRYLLAAKVLAEGFVEARKIGYVPQN